MLCELWKWITSFLTLIYNYIRWVIRNCSSSYSDNVDCLVDKTAIITGGNSGIGYATALLLASRGCRIILACRRDATKVKDGMIKLTGNTNIVTKYLDLAKLESVRKFAEDINRTESKIDILVNNAGIGASSEICTNDGLNTVMQVNYYGHFLLTHLLVDKLKASNSAKVVFLSSLTIWYHQLKFSDLNIVNLKQMDGITVSDFYINSKLCNILAAQKFAEKLNQYGMKVNCVDPGIARTPIYHRTDKIGVPDNWFLNYLLKAVVFLHVTDELKSAQDVFHVAVSRNLYTGTHYFRCHPFIKPGILSDPELCENIWRKSEELVKLSSNERLV